MKITLRTECNFEAAHQLCGYNGKCSRLHGHNWKVECFVRGTTEDFDNVGILWDFKNLKNKLEELDHQLLNEVLEINPTAEQLAVWLTEEFSKAHPKLMFRIRVWENDKSYAETGEFI